MEHTTHNTTELIASYPESGVHYNKYFLKFYCRPTVTICETVGSRHVVSK